MFLFPLTPKHWLQTIITKWLVWYMNKMTFFLFHTFITNSYVVQCQVWRGCSGHREPPRHWRPCSCSYHCPRDRWHLIALEDSWWLWSQLASRVRPLPLLQFGWYIWSQWASCPWATRLLGWEVPQQHTQTRPFGTEPPFRSSRLYWTRKTPLQHNISQLNKDWVFQITAMENKQRLCDGYANMYYYSISAIDTVPCASMDEMQWVIITRCIYPLCLTLNIQFNAGGQYLACRMNNNSRVDPSVGELNSGDG